MSIYVSSLRRAACRPGGFSLTTASTDVVMVRILIVQSVSLLFLANATSSRLTSAETPTPSSSMVHDRGDEHKQRLRQGDERRCGIHTSDPMQKNVGTQSRATFYFRPALVPVWPITKTTDLVCASANHTNAVLSRWLTFHVGKLQVFEPAIAPPTESPRRRRGQYRSTTGIHCGRRHQPKAPCR